MALLTFQSGDSVKQALYDELLNLMNADKDIRTKAEVKVKHLEFTEGNNSHFPHKIRRFFLISVVFIRLC